MRHKILAIVIALSLALNSTALAQDRGKILIPIGGFNSVSISGFIETILERAGSSDIRIVIIPFGFGSNPDQISSAERDQIMTEADQTRLALAQTCELVKPVSQKCEVSLAPILSRSDANDENLVATHLRPNLTAILLLGGDLAKPDHTISETVLEAHLAQAYQHGVIIAGSNAGAAIQSQTLLTGYRASFQNNNALNFGAVELWSSNTHHGLPFGVRDAILDQQVFTQGHLGRLLNAISLPDAPHLGIGLDQNTGLQVIDGQEISQVFGQSAVTVFDAETYHAAVGVQYCGDKNLLSLRNVLVHMLAPGGNSYNLSHRQHSLAAPAPYLDRGFSSLELPQNAGSLILAGDLSSPLPDHPVLVRFINQSGGENAVIQVVTVGYTSAQSAQAAAEPFIQEINASAKFALFIAPGIDHPLEISKDITGILLLSEDSTPVQTELLGAIEQSWKSGTPLMAAGNAVALVGKSIPNKFEPLQTNKVEAGQVPTENSLRAKFESSLVFKNGDEGFLPGLELLNVNLVSGILAENRWADLFSLAVHDPSQIALGLSDDTAIELDSIGAKVIGSNMVFSLDLRSAALEVGENGAPVIANGLLDAFAANDLLAPIPADVNAAPIALATPSAPVPTPTISATPTFAPTDTPTPIPSEEPENQGHPTRTLRPTATPRTPPPPSDPGMTSLMIAFGVMAVVVVIFGLLINRGRQ